MIKGIIALDPGGTTGVAYYNFAKDKWERVEVPHCDDIRNVHGLLSILSGYAVDFEPLLAKHVLDVVCERFEFRHEERFRDKIDYTASEVIGCIKLWCLQRPFTELHMQGASQAKAFWTDDKLKKLGVWVPGQRHAMDATRHALYHRAFTLNDISLFTKFRHVPDDVIEDGI